MSFISELQHRRVFRVAALYGVVAWLITEISSVVLPALLLPQWTITLVIVLLIFGFPIAMIMAWIFDIGPEGIQRTEPLPTGSSRLSKRNAYAVYGGLLIAGTLILGTVLYFRGWEPWKYVERDSIAVLPFDNLSRDPGNDYFSDGIAEELLNMLTQVPGLKVAARTSSFAYKDRQVDVREIARQLGVESVLEGTVRWADTANTVRITAQLIDADSGYHLWSQTYDRELDSIFAVQDEIAMQIVKALRLQLAADQTAETISRSQPPTSDIDAYQLYLRGRHVWKRRGRESIELSIELYQAALARDPGFARAQSALAAAYVLLPEYIPGDERTLEELAAEAARQALVLDANLAEAHAVLALINAGHTNWTDAEAGFFFATALDPNEPTPHHWYSVLLRQVGRLEEALSEARRAYELDPTSPILNLNLASVYYLLGDDAQAIKFIDQAEELGLHQPSLGLRVGSLLRQGRDAEVIALLNSDSEQHDRSTDWAPALVRAYHSRGESPSPVELPVEEDQSSVDEQLMVHLVTGQVDAAYAMAYKAIAQDKRIEQWFWLPEAASFRQDPRFTALLEQNGLVDYWMQYGWPKLCQRSADGFVCD